jgi:hypothetical protein
VNLGIARGVTRRDGGNSQTRSYTSESGVARTDDAAQWEREKQAYLEELRRKTNLTDEVQIQYSTLQQITYDQFVVWYLDDSEPGQPNTYGSSRFYVGHVGVIDVVDEQPYVVEAVLGHGVRRIAYGKWLEGRPGELVWLGRPGALAPSSASRTRGPRSPSGGWGDAAAARGEKRGFICYCSAWGSSMSREE